MLYLKAELSLTSSYLNDLRLKALIEEQTRSTSAHQPETPTHPYVPADTSAHPHEIGGLISPKTSVSTGNEGVPTDRQTDSQADRQTLRQINIDDKPSINQLEKASEILSSLDSLKKEVRLKFKRLTSQEMQVFSMLYSLEDQGIIVDYSLLSLKLQLSESSIRDYISKIQKKGIPILKEKLNNKKILLHISLDLKKIASLNTILSLRNI
jgi:hypothetical protein